eukprot:TRINITY_DN64720_c0_g1_i1.p1 TRINITY_DN64720_c0_g1~~TRINITY_DN64720_c0_g1_i1.p1  ORF type:complete len:224 (+),score=32.47 TRINITY_DN64720_c0_g1_i1:59-673(+)
MANPADVVGWYNFSWSGGVFDVCFRPAGHFWVPRFQAAARWEMEDDKIKIDWGRYGKYDMTFNAETKSMDGICTSVANPNPEKDWRKADFREPLRPVEALLIGLGAGTEWDFEHEGGSFPIQFKADGYNHFKCNSFPAHAHWSLVDENKVVINWAEFGKYELVVDVDTKTMEGGVQGNLSDWRKAVYVRDNEDLHTVEACTHHH